MNQTKYFKILRGTSIGVERELNDLNIDHTINIINAFTNNVGIIYIIVHIGPLKDNSDGLSNS